MTGAPDLPVLTFPAPTDWEAWLAEHHDRSPGAWLRLAKKGATTITVSYDEALEVALCFGWIDGPSASYDARFWLQRFTPRRPRSSWSKRNRDRVARLMAEGRMRPAGILQVERAQADGRWDAAYDGPATAEVPDDLARALAANPQAAAFFATLDSTNRYAILYRLQDAKRPATRERRLAQFVAMLAEGRRIHEW